MNMFLGVLLSQLRLHLAMCTKVSLTRAEPHSHCLPSIRIHARTNNQHVSARPNPEEAQVRMCLQFSSRKKPIKIALNHAHAMPERGLKQLDPARSFASSDALREITEST